MSASHLLDVDDLSVSFPIGSAWRRKASFRAVDGVSFHIDPGETLAVVGESGSGKSTTARAVLRLLPPSGGTVRLDGVDLTTLSRAELRRARQRMQMVFQDPYSSLDPSMVVAESVGEPLQVHTSLDTRGRHQRVGELLEQVGLSPHHLERYPYEFSGGQRQRLAIARAIALEPSLVVCDEAVSALDVSTQNQIINLLEDLQGELGVSYLFISHDLAVVRHIAHRVAVMYLGRIVESGPVERIFGATAHPYTEALLSAVPVPDPEVQRGAERIILRGDVPDPTRPPQGCAFHLRCPHVMDICRTTRPAVTPVDGGGEVACWLQVDGPRLGGRPLRALQATTTDGAAPAAITTSTP